MAGQLAQQPNSHHYADSHFFMRVKKEKAMGVGGGGM